MKNKILLSIGILAVVILIIGIGSAATTTTGFAEPSATTQFQQTTAGNFQSSTSFGFSNAQYIMPNYQTYYSGVAGEGLGTMYSTYWPILFDRNTCEARQDVLLQVAPLGCQPAVVRSDLLADQNVPVFCQIDALQLNPLLSIKDIKNIRFSGKYPAEVIGAGFHPARAAIRTRDSLLGDPLINNVGYLVVVLKKNPKESELPDFVNLTLTAQLQYDAGNALGIGKAEFKLKPQSDDEWANEKDKQSFWNGRFFLKLEDAQPDYALVSIYSGDRKVGSQRVAYGKTSDEIYLPGFYCRAALQVAYDGLEAEQAKARIEISDESGTDAFDVYEKSKFLNDACYVERISIDKNLTDSGSVTLVCGSDKTTLELKPAQLPVLSVLKDANSNKIAPTKQIINFNGQNTKAYVADLGKGTGKFGLTDSGEFVYFYSLNFDEEGSWELVDNSYKKEHIGADKKEFTDSVKNALSAYKIQKEGANSSKISQNSLLTDTALDNEQAEQEFKNAIAAYESIADDYPAEREGTALGSVIYGEEALYQAVLLTEKPGIDGLKTATKERLLRKLIDKYPESGRMNEYLTKLTNSYKVDTSKAGSSVKVLGTYKTIRLVSLKAPKAKPNADITIEGQAKKIELDERDSLIFAGTKQIKPATPASKPEQKVIVENNKYGEYRVEKVNKDDITITAFCNDKKDDKGNIILSSGKSFTLKTGQDAQEICNLNIKLVKTDVERVARIRLLPKAANAETETNLSVNIGIEKRAIQLSPEKTLEKIQTLNETIKKWETIEARLAKVVTGMKTACFATAGVLTVKNFLSGIDGSALARQQAMTGVSGWSKRCEDAIATGRIDRNGDGITDADVSYKSMTECFNGESTDINKEVSARTDAIKNVNERMKDSEAGAVSGDSLGGKVINNEQYRAAYLEKLKAKYPNDPFIAELYNKKQDENKFLPYTTADLREIDYYNEMKNEGYGERADKEIANIKNKIDTNQKEYDAYKKSTDILQTIGAKSTVIGTKGQTATVNSATITKTGTDIKLNERTNVAINSGGSLPDGTSAGAFVSGVRDVNKVKESKNYFVAGRKQGSEFLPLKVYDYSVDKNTNTITLTENNDYKDIGKFKADYSVSSFEDTGISVSYSNPIRASDRKVQYFEIGPDKGLPALVPFDTKNGWYARVNSNLKVGNQIPSYDSSGLPKSWYICNVGSDLTIDAQDNCQLVTEGATTNQPILGLDKESSAYLIKKSREALMSAAEQKGKNIVRINGEDFMAGAASPYQGVQCQDFMSPEDCKILFNVCDPVICPATRCNLGGNYQVADVIQTGIVGSALLCLPNIREGIVMPVCLTGIDSGIQAYLSILKAHRDCLQENLNSGQMIGICDQIYSVYLCEFFWRQIAPIANMILPKIVEMAYGQGARGGGEYLTVMGAWQNTQKSIDYFTQVYAVNSMKSFQIRSIEDAGTPFCKAFISMKGPSSFKNLVEPDSPPQFYASFDSTPYTSATIPATSQYKVFYHIFAGKDAGVAYSVYLKNGPEYSYYYVPSAIYIANGFVSKGDYKSETRDFTAPEGYKELCVRINDEEKCGFKQVSTDFAVNYLKDAYVKDQMTQTNINSESDCISGTSPALGAALANTNLESMAQEAAFPQNYQRGIVRICSSKNPGATTDPTRYAEVGNCGDPTLKCWLDKQSVSNAITDSNVGMKNETLAAVEDAQKNALQKEGIVLTDGDANSKINELRDRTGNENSGWIKDISNAPSLSEAKTIYLSAMNEFDNAFGARLDKLFYSHHKADVSLLKARLQAAVLSPYEKSKISEIKTTTTASTATQPATQTTTPAADNSGKQGISLSEKYNPANKIFLLKDGQQQSIYFISNKVMLQKKILGADVLAADEQLGSVQSSVIVLLSSKKDSIDASLFNSLSGAKISENNIVPATSSPEQKTITTPSINTLLFEYESGGYTKRFASDESSIPVNSNLFIYLDHNCNFVKLNVKKGSENVLDESRIISSPYDKLIKNSAESDVYSAEALCYGSDEENPAGKKTTKVYVLAKAVAPIS